MSSLETQNTKRKQTVIESARGMAVGTLLSRVIGFVRDAVLFALFDRTYTDAISVAYRLPNVFRRLLSEGALGATFIPIYVSSARRRDVADAAMSALLALTLTLVGLGVIFMPWIIHLLVGQTETLVVDLARIMMGSLTLVALYAFYSAVANAHHYFFWPSFAAALFNVCNVLFLLWGSKAGVSPLVPAWGVLVGGLAQWALVATVLVKAQALPRFTWQWRGSGLDQLVRRIGPSLIGVGLFQALTLINMRFAASVGEGAQSYLWAADRLLELPQSLVAVSIGSALLPRFAERAEDREWLLHEISRAVRFSLFLILPASLGLFFLSRSIVQALFERGHFGPQDATMTAELLSVYAGLLIFASLSRIIQTVFYSLHMTRIPGWTALTVILAHLGLSTVLVSKWGLLGVACTTTVSAFLYGLVLLVFLVRKIGWLDGGMIIREGLRWSPGLLGLVVFATQGPQWFSVLGSSVALVVSVGLAALSYLSLALVCGSQDARELLGRVR